MCVVDSIIYQCYANHSNLVPTSLILCQPLWYQHHFNTSPHPQLDITSPHLTSPRIKSNQINLTSYHLKYCIAIFSPRLSSQPHTWSTPFTSPIHFSSISIHSLHLPPHCLPDTVSLPFNHYKSSSSIYLPLLVLFASCTNVWMHLLDPLQHNHTTFFFPLY